MAQVERAHRRAAAEHVLHVGDRAGVEVRQIDGA